MRNRNEDVQYCRAYSNRSFLIKNERKPTFVHCPHRFCFDLPSSRRLRFGAPRRFTLGERPSKFERSMHRRRLLRCGVRCLPRSFLLIFPWFVATPQKARTFRKSHHKFSSSSSTHKILPHSLSLTLSINKSCLKLASHLAVRFAAVN